MDSEQQSIRPGRRRRTHHANAGMMRQHRFETFRVVLGRVNTAAMRHAHDERQRDAASRAMAHARHVIGDLVHGGIDESHELDFRDRLQALTGHAQRHARDHALRERRVLYAILAEFLLQAGGGAEHAAIHADVLAEHDHRRVVRHFPRVRAVDGLDHRHLRHERASVPAGSGVTPRQIALSVCRLRQLGEQEIEHCVGRLLGRLEVLLDGRLDFLRAGRP